MHQNFNYDTLTSLPDRASFLQYLSREQFNSLSHQVCALMFINLDDFRLVNQKLGYSIGDEVLKKVTERLLAVKAPHDVLARLSGDEFGLLIMDVHSAVDIDVRANRIIDAAQESYEINEHDVTLHCSVGITAFFSDEFDLDTIMQSTAAALYQAKEEGKNTFRFFEEGMHIPIQRRVKIGSAIKSSIQNEFSGFSLVYQPRLDLSSDRVVGAEALLRFHTNELGNVTPYEFIPVAEQSNTINALGEWVLYQACQQAVSWIQQSGMEITIAVNLSAKQFRDAGLVTKVADILTQTDLPSELLELELTESMLMYDLKQGIETMKQLKAIGVKLAIDDFGTGYSSLSYLKDFPVDYLKIDRSFVAHMQGLKEKAIIQTVISMAHLLDLRVIAEGVETVEQLNFLLAEDCDEVQGFLISHPVPPAVIMEIHEHGLKLDLGSELHSI